MKKKITLDSKLKKYTALASGLTVAAGAVQAQIVYTDINPDALVTGHQVGIGIDFDGNTTTDVTLATLINSFTGVYTYGTTVIPYTFSYTGAVGSVGTGANSGWMASNTSNAPFSNVTSGAAIGGAGTFRNGQGDLGLMQGTYWGAPYNYQVGPNANGNFLGAVDGFIGVKFDIAGQAHYGWVRVDLSADGITLTVKDYAYNATPGVAINAGATTDVLGTPTIAQGAPVLCAGDATGELTATPVGGMPAYTYAWTDGGGSPAGTTQTITGLVAGTYTVVITDGNSDTATETFVITEPTALSASTTLVTDEILGNDGGIDITATGGTPANTYSWDNGATTEDLTNVVGGTYVVTITDGNGCTFIHSETVTSYVGVDEKASQIAKIFPNPTTGTLNVQLDGTNGNVEVMVLDLTGRVISKETRLNPTNVELDLSGFSAGVYSVKVVSENSTSEVKVIKK